MTKFKLNLQNLGSDSTIKDVSAIIHPAQKWLVSTRSSQRFGDIVLGDTVTSPGTMGINLDPACHSQTIPVRLDVYSEDVLYWSSEIIFDVELPLDVKIELPKEYTLFPSYPNPFNPSTTISYDLPEQSTVNLTIFDIQGREIMQLNDETKPAGCFQVQWNGIDQSGNPVSAGVYFARLEAGSYSQTIKMLYLK